MSPEMRSIHVLQPAIPTYRHDFFERLSRAFPDRFFVHASQQDLGALTATSNTFSWQRALGPIKSIAPGVSWQVGAVGLPIRRGDILILSGAPRTLSNIILMLRARFIGAHVVWWGHYLSPNSPFWRRTLRILLMRAAQGVLLYTDAEIAAYRQSWLGRRDTRPLQALNNGLNIDPIDQHREAYDANNRPKDMLFIGRLSEKARIDVAIEALADDRLSDVRLQVIGEGETEATARQLADHLGVAGRIVWNGALTDEAEIGSIANRCRVFLYPGDVGLSLIHGLAYGLPAVVHDDTASHMPEIAAFEAGVNGRTFRRGDADDLAGAVDSVIHDAPYLARLSESALMTVSSGYNTENMTKRFLEMIAAVLTMP